VHIAQGLALKKTSSVRNIVARSRNHCWKGKAAMLSLCIVELHVTVSNIKMLSVAQKLQATMKRTQVLMSNA
jgi:hypothetical protein